MEGACGSLAGQLLGLQMRSNGGGKLGGVENRLAGFRGCADR